MQRNIQEECAGMERWKKMMDSMINFITVSSELVEKLNNKLDGKSVSVNKASKEPEILFMKNPPGATKGCAANRARDRTLGEEMAKEQLEKVLSKVGIEDSKGSCCCSHKESGDIEKMKMKLKSAENDLKILHSEINRLASKTSTRSAPGASSTPNPATLYRQIMKDVSQFEVQQQPMNRNAETQLNLPFVTITQGETSSRASPYPLRQQIPPPPRKQRIPQYFKPIAYSTTAQNHPHPRQIRQPYESMYPMPVIRGGHYGATKSYLADNPYARQQSNQMAKERKYYRPEENANRDLLNTAMIMSDEEYEQYDENIPYDKSCASGCGVVRNRKCES